jgi:3-oxoisoapionate kinase
MNREAPYLCFYGDDFTGSTDALDALWQAGIRAVLFLEVPDESVLAKFAGTEAIGIAGMSRTMSPEAMAASLPGVFRWMAATGAAILHYKVCSTFDSAPLVGSIGKAIDIAAAELGQAVIPILVGVPKLGRYCVFGNLFARAGSNPEIFRIDRHPVMSRHPQTPMAEADLRRHLGLQTDVPIDLISVIDLDARTLPPRQAAQEPRALLFDTLTADHLTTIGDWLHAQADQHGQRLFCVGSSALEYALTDGWPDRRSLKSSEPTPRGADAPIAGVSGSCSPVTARQIERAATAGFAPIELPVESLQSGNVLRATTQVTRAARDALAVGHSPLIYTARGQAASVPVNPAELGGLLGDIIGELIDSQQLTRVAVAGGDTSGFVAARLGLQALEVAAPISPGAPLCKAYRASGATLEIALKGGQMGSEDYFLKVRSAQVAGSETASR